MVATKRPRTLSLPFFSILNANSNVNAKIPKPETVNVTEPEPKPETAAYLRRSQLAQAPSP